MNGIFSKNNTHSELINTPSEVRAAIDQDDTTRWIELIKEYANIQEMDSTTLQRLIKRIVIHEDLDGGIIRQTVEIHFNFMGQPDTYKLIRE